MKKHLPFLLLLLLIACVSQPDQADLAKGTLGYKLENHSHHFTLDSTAILISDFLAKPELNSMASSYALGGAFPASELKLLPNSVGIIFWFCFKGGSNPELFLACEQLEKFDLSNMPKHPSGKILMRPAYTFNNKEGVKASAPAVKEYLQSQVIQKVAVQPVDNASVIRYINSFDSLMNTIASRNGEKYNRFPFSFFVRNNAQEIERLLKQAGDDGYVKYYFGFDERDKPNRIRVILMTGSAGSNTIMTRQKDEPLILQKSVPPPPLETGD